ncbi:hypothetical protein H8E88_27475 [candidate division KSB1 bacterium]|nr:hypothetical protein [candidate division KSB1 bacterium]
MSPHAHLKELGGDELYSKKLQTFLKARDEIQKKSLTKQVISKIRCNEKVTPEK